MPFFTVNNHECRSSWRIATVLATLLLAAPKLAAESPGAALRARAESQRKVEQAETDKQELKQQQAEAKRQTDQAAEKARQKEQEYAELRKKAEATEQELARQRLKNTQPKTEPAAEQRIRQLEKQVAKAKRKAEEEGAEKQDLGEQLAKEKRKTEQAEAEQRRLEAELEKSSGAVNTFRPETVTSPPEGTRTTASSAIGSTLKDCEDCPELVVIPSGEFVMGSPDTESKINSDEEGPQHTVHIGYTLAVGKYEVTFAEWDACLAEGGCAYKPSDNGWGRGKRPVINVSWNDIKQQYLPWLNRKAGLSARSANQQYRLLSEAEWEYVARAGTSTAFSFGDHITADVANFAPTVSQWVYSQDNFNHNGSPYRQQTVPVDSFVPNAWGLYNVHGNVDEWVEDCYKDSYNGAPNDGRIVQETGCSQRVLRGGSWNDISRYLRSSKHYFRGSPDSRSDESGFRLARMLP